MALKVEMLRCFVTVARSGNLATAAEKLGRTTSAVSMMLKQFEERLGAPLFESERKSRLTPLGRSVMEEAIRGLESFDRTTAAIEAFARSDAGRVRVAAVPSVAEAVLPAVAQEFLKDHPGVWIDIQDMDSAAVLRELERERVDIGFATGTNAGREIDRQLLFSDPFGIVCRADHPLATSQRPVKWEELVTFPFIANGVCGVIQNPMFQRIFDASIMMVRNTTSLLAMVRANVGITVLPRLVIHDAERALRFLPVTDSMAQRRIDVLRRSDITPSPAVAKFEQATRRITTEISAGWSAREQAGHPR